MSWFFGGDSVSKISLLKKQLVRYQLNKIRLIYPEISIDQYHPLLNCPTFLSMDKVLALNGESLSPVDFSYSKLVVTKEVYESLPFLLAMHGERRYLKVFDQILSYEPNAESEFNSAVELLRVKVPWMMDIYEVLVDEICPITYGNNSRSDMAFSDYNLIGVLFLSLPQFNFSTVRLSVSLAHELAHNVLYIYQAGQDPVGEKSQGQEVYSAVRRRKRPVHSSLHALLAISYMIIVIRHILLDHRVIGDQRMYLKKENLTLSTELRKSFELYGTIELNEIGTYLLSEIKILLEGDLLDPVF